MKKWNIKDIEIFIKKEMKKWKKLKMGTKIKEI